MRRLLASINLTAILALAAVSDLVLYRLIDPIFLPSQPEALSLRLLSAFAIFSSQLSTVLGIVVVALTLSRLVRDEAYFPRGMRITVSTIALFFLSLASLSALSVLVSPRYQLHLRISQAFLIFFLLLASWHSRRPMRSRVALTLLGVPLILQVLAVFLSQIASTRIDPVSLARLGRAGLLLFLLASPLLLVAVPLTRRSLVAGLVAGIGMLGGLVAATLARFDVVQVVAYYGLRMDLTGLSERREQWLMGVIIMAYACLAFTIAACLAKKGPSRLIGWGMLLLGATGLEANSPKLTLFSLCVLFALSMAGVADAREVEVEVETQT